jgi:IclR family acetate operon transcriptional repressor
MSKDNVTQSTPASGPHGAKRRIDDDLAADWLARGKVAEEERRVPLLKAMRIIEWIATSDQSSWGVRELARALDMAPSTAHRLLAMLEEASIVESDESTGRYCIALDFFRLASRIALKLPIRDTAARYLRDLADRTGEAVYLARYDARKKAFMYVDYVKSRHPLRYEMALYEWLDLRVGAGGLGILSFLPAQEIDSVLRQPKPPKLTSRTITERRLIEAELARIREQGYVVSLGRRIVGAVGIAAPIFGSLSRVLGVVVLALPESRFPDYDVERLGHDVVNTAHAVSTVLGAHQPTSGHSGHDLANW